MLDELQEIECDIIRGSIPPEQLRCLEDIQMHHLNFRALDPSRNVSRYVEVLKAQAQPPEAGTN